MQNMIPTHNGLMRETELDRINLHAIKEYRLGNGSFIWEKVNGNEIQTREQLHSLYEKARNNRSNIKAIKNNNHILVLTKGGFTS